MRLKRSWISCQYQLDPVHHRNIVKPPNGVGVWSSILSASFLTHHTTCLPCTLYRTVFSALFCCSAVAFAQIHLYSPAGLCGTPLSSHLQAQALDTCQVTSGAQPGPRVSDGLQNVLSLILSYPVGWVHKDNADQKPLKLSQVINITVVAEFLQKMIRITSMIAYTISPLSSWRAWKSENQNKNNQGLKRFNLCVMNIKLKFFNHEKQPFHNILLFEILIIIRYIWHGQFTTTDVHEIQSLWMFTANYKLNGGLGSNLCPC